MMDHPIAEHQAAEGELFYLPKRRKRKSIREQADQDLALAMVQFFREQNALLRENNAVLQDNARGMSDKVQRLTLGVERLVEEMNGVRTGRKDEAFARVASCDASPDLPTVAAEAALIYTQTAENIGVKLGFRASQIGLLLSQRGLGWAGNGDFQEMTRHKKKNQKKFWHQDVPNKLQLVLNEGFSRKTRNFQQGGSGHVSCLAETELENGLAQ